MEKVTACIIFVLFYFCFSYKKEDSNLTSLDYKETGYSSILRALTAVELNSYIAILAPPKHKNPHYSSGVKGKKF